MTFKHWIAIDKAHSLPIPNRLSPSHYGMLYYIKGDKPRVFQRDRVRTSIQSCRHCGRDVKDYRGHKKFLNPKGLNLTDVWELAPIILERIVRLTTEPGDLVCDPFSGGGVTAFVAETLERRWACGDINDCRATIERLENLKHGVHPSWETNKRRIVVEESSPSQPTSPSALPR